MKLLTSTFFIALLIGSTFWCVAALRTPPNSPFDQYGGGIRWEDEKARLDNFAIALEQDKQAVGFILTYDKTGGCPGEAAARALRAKRYLTEYRRIPWNQIMWRRDGYKEEISTTLLILPTRT